MFMLNKIYLNLNLNQFSWLLNKHKLYYEKLRIRSRGFEIPNHLTKDSNPMCYISKGFESAESESGFGFGPIPGMDYFFNTQQVTACRHVILYLNIVNLSITMLNRYKTSYQDK